MFVNGCAGMTIGRDDGQTHTLTLPANHNAVGTAMRARLAAVWWRRPGES